MKRLKLYFYCWLEDVTYAISDWAGDKADLIFCKINGVTETTESDIPLGYEEPFISVDMLEQDLSIALENDDYEMAAAIRDMISRVKEGKPLL